MADTFLQHWLFTRFAFPFLLVFFIVFAILERTKIFGESKRQLNALVSFVIGLIFVSFAYPVDVVSNLILFLTVALIVTFVGLLIWSFVAGGDKLDIGKFKTPFAVILIIAIVVAVVWATGAIDPITDWLFKQEWSGTFWTNVFFVVLVAAAIAFVLIGSGKSKK